MARHINAFGAIALSMLAGSTASAQTIVVNTSSEAVDFAAPNQVANLPGPDGKISLQEAVQAANNTPGPQTIHFAIPRNEWEESLFPGIAMIQYDSFLVLLSGDDTTIDFTTQRNFTGDTNPNGEEVGLHYMGPTSAIPYIYVTGSNCTIKGLGTTFGNAFGASVFITGNNNRVIGCTTSSVEIDAFDGQATGNVIGGTATGEGNTLLSVRLDGGASGNTIVGNKIRGLQILGDTLYGACRDNRVGGATPAEGNVISGNGRSGEEGLPIGVQVELLRAERTILENNRIGTTPDGLAASTIRNGTLGIGVGDGCVGTVIRSNTIAGIARTGSNHYQGLRFGVALQVSGSSSSTTIVGNRIGVGIDGVTPILNVAGVLFTTQTAISAVPTGIRFGGSAPGEGNIVANSERFGLMVSQRVNGARISRSTFASNGGLAIDLLTSGGAAGVSPNDANDTDDGGNRLQNTPVLSSAAAGGGTLRVVGSVQSVPGEQFTIELFASDACDAAGFGEGARFVGAVSVTTDAGGQGEFDFSATSDEAAGVAITATATRESTGDTSEFSACFTASQGVGSCRADLDNGSGTGTPDQAVSIDDLIYMLAQFEQGSLRADLDDGSGNGVLDQAVGIEDLVYFLVRFENGC